MKFVQRVVGRDGVERLYFRKKGLPAMRLRQAWGSAALQEEIDGLLRAMAVPKARPGTLRGLLRAYELESADFRGLADSTKYEYRRLLGEFDEDLGALAVSAFTPAYVQRLRDLWAKRGHRAANLRLQVLRNVLKPALVAEDLEKDPFPLVGQVRRPSHLAEPHLIWPADVVASVLNAAIGKKRFGLARAVAIARYTGARRGDLVKIRPEARQEGRIRFRSGKRAIPIDVPEDPELASWLAVIPAAQPQDPRPGRKVPANVRTLPPVTLVFNLENLRYSEDGLGLELGKLVADLHRKGELESDRYDLHGLRHTRGVELALAGCTDAQGAAMMGHASPNSFAQYRRQADRIRMSDDGDQKVRDLRERVQNAEVKNEVEKGCKIAPPSASESGR